MDSKVIHEGDILRINTRGGQLNDVSTPSTFPAPEVNELIIIGVKDYSSHANYEGKSYVIPREKKFDYRDGRDFDTIAKWTKQVRDASEKEYIEIVTRELSMHHDHKVSPGGAADSTIIEKEHVAKELSYSDNLRSIEPITEDTGIQRASVGKASLSSKSQKQSSLDIEQRDIHVHVPASQQMYPISQTDDGKSYIEFDLKWIF